MKFSLQLVSAGRCLGADENWWVGTAGSAIVHLNFCNISFPRGGCFATLDGSERGKPSVVADGNCG
jgi:hypothetical protein